MRGGDLVSLFTIGFTTCPVQQVKSSPTVTPTNISFVANLCCDPVNNIVPERISMERLLCPLFQNLLEVLFTIWLEVKPLVIKPTERSWFEVNM